MQIDEINIKASRFRDVYEEFSLSKYIKLDQALKISPYYGYIKINISKVDEFLMFSNNDDFVAQTYFFNGCNAYEAMTLKIWSALSLQSKYVFDVGSYSGLYSLVTAKKNTQSKIYAFEALDRVYARLIINKKVNDFKNIKAFNLAVSNCCEPIELNVYSGDSILVSASSIIERPITRKIYEKKYVNSIAIDQFLTANNIARIDLMKIDTEGAEHLVLEGAIETIRKFKPDIICELLCENYIKEIEHVLKSIGYNFFKIDDKNISIEQQETLSKAKGMNDLNILMTTKSETQIMDLLKN